MSQRASKERGLLLRSPPVWVAAAVVLSLWASVALIRWLVDEARQASVRGEGEAFVHAVQSRWPYPFRPPEQRQLEELLDAQQQAGLRYVAVQIPGRGRIEAGLARGHILRPGVAERLGERVRLAQAIPRPRMSPLGAHDLPPPPHASRGPQRPPGPPGPGFDGRPPLPDPPLIIVEYEPVLARSLAWSSNMLLVVALTVGVLIFGLAVSFARSLLEREQLSRRLSEERRLAALGEASAVLAHEIRNPLASLKGHAQLLVEQLPGGSRERTKAETVVKEAVRLECLTNELLDFVRTGTLHRSAVDPGQLLRDVAARFLPAEVSVSVAEGLSRVHLDAERMNQAIGNLLENALAVSAAGAPIEMRAFVDAEALHIEVLDRGPGIAQGTEQQLFEPFFTQRVRGTGLGLPIARRIVEQHGGSLEAENRQGGGACFRILLPASAHAAQPASGQARA